MYQYSAVIERWIDGDTVEVNADLGFFVHIQLSVRLAGINTPELHSPDPLERDKAKLARLRAMALCPVGSTVIVETHTQEKYGRWLGTVFQVLPDKSMNSVALILIAEGFGVPYDGGKR